MTSPYPLNSKDRKDLEVYIKQFCFKSIQTIVCSRHGHTISSDSSSRTPSWFNIALTDNPSVAEDCKQKVSVTDLFHGKTISLTIQLHTPENEDMTLEVWTFSLEKRYEQVKVTFTVYNALCLLLRSIIVASRATPTYRLTRKQTTGGFFHISYVINTEEAPIGELGDSIRSERIGVVGTPSGTITANVFYRTTLEIPASSPVMPVSVFDRDDENIETPPTDVTDSHESDSLPFCPFADTALPHIWVPINQKDITSTNLIEEKETPFASLLESAFPFSQTTSVALSQISEASPKEEEAPASPLPKSAELATPTPALFGSPRLQELQNDIMTSDSFVLIAPFASNSPEDVGSFFRDCASIPKLKLFIESESQSSLVNPAEVEQDVKEIEDFLNELSLDDTDATDLSG